MAPNGTDGPSASEPLDPETLTERFDDLETGDTFRVNDRESTYEVVDTDTYSVVAEDADGTRVVISMNLQSGGWTLSEDVVYVEPA